MATYYYENCAGTAGTTLAVSDPSLWSSGSSYLHGAQGLLDGKTWGPSGSGGIYSNGQGCQIPTASMPSTANYVMSWTYYAYSAVINDDTGINFYASSPFGTFANSYQILGYGSANNVFHFANNYSPGPAISFTPTLNKLYYCRVYVVIQGVNTLFIFQYSVDNSTWVNPSGNSYVIATPAYPISVGPIFNVATTATTGQHIGQLTLADITAPTSTSQINNSLAFPSGIMSSGASVALNFTKISNGAAIQPLFLISPPTVRNVTTSTNVTLGVPYIDSYNPYVVFPLTNPAQWFGYGQQASITTTGGWLFMSDAGGANALTGAPLTNSAGASFFGTDSITRTFSPGFNVSSGAGVNTNSITQLFANLRYKLANVSGFTAHDSGGNPTTLNTASVTQPCVNINASNQCVYPTGGTGPGTGINATEFPSPTGYVAIGYYDNAYGTGNQANLSLVTTDSTQCTVTQDSTCTGVQSFVNQGGGTYAVYQMYNIQVASGSSTVNTPWGLNWNCTGLNPRVTNLKIYGPGDFSYTPGQPLNFSLAEPVSGTPTSILLNNFFMDRMANGCGCLRWDEACLPSNQGGNTNITETWEMHQLNDFSWNNSLKRSINAGMTQIRPLTTDNSPYVYGDFGGSTWVATATLAGGGMDASQTTLTLSTTGDTIFYGIMLTIDSEYMRCTGISGTTVTVVRAQAFNGVLSTAASHSSGSVITLGNRMTWAAGGANIYQTFGGQNTQVVEFVSASPHGLKAGQYFKIASPSGNPIPALTCTDYLGNVSSCTLSPQPVFPTGPTTFLQVVFNTCPYPATLTTTYSLNSSANTITYQLPEACAPPELAAMVCSQVNCNMHINIPFMASDTLVFYWANAIFANMTPGRSVYVELADEWWNSGAALYEILQTQMAGRIAGVNGPSNYTWAVYRQGQIGQIFQTVFGSRASEIINLLPSQMGSPGNVGEQVITAATNATSLANNYIFGAYCVAPYFQTDNDNASSSYFTELLPQSGSSNTDYTSLLADFTMLSLNYNTNPTNSGSWLKYMGTPGTNGVAGTHLNNIYNYNTWLTANYGLNTYPPMVLTAYEGGYAAGSPSGAFSEIIAGITPPSPANATYNLNRDIKYDPVWRIYQKDFYALLQKYGFADFNRYAMSNPPFGNNQWCCWYWAGQPNGKGDGSDGQADNRLARAMPGYAGSITQTQNQDLVSVSVEGQAFLEWMLKTTPPIIVVGQPFPMASPMLIMM